MPKIMIVDDAAFMRMSIRMILEKNNYEVVAEAIDGLDAVDKYSMFKPDMVTMDITMPQMSGLEALKKIRELDPKAKVLMVSALGQENIVKEAILAGAQSFIVKPFKEDKFLQVISKIVG